MKSETDDKGKGVVLCGHGGACILMSETGIPGKAELEEEPEVVRIDALGSKAHNYEFHFVFLFRLETVMKTLATQKPMWLPGYYISPWQEGR